MALDKINEFLHNKIHFIIMGNKNTQIHDNKIELVLDNTSRTIEPFARNYMEYKEFKDILEETRVIESIYERQELLVQKLEILNALYNKNQQTLVVRFWGMYSGLSTIRSYFDKSEMSSLEWDEKKLLIDLVKKRFPVKMILTLNIEKVLSFGYTLDNICQRIEDMCEVCKELEKYDNFQMVIDEEKDIDSTIVIDGILMMRQYDFANESFNYRKSYWTSDSRILKEFCYKFEDDFSRLEKNYFLTRKIFACDTYEEYVRVIMNSRIEQYLKKHS